MRAYSKRASIAWRFCRAAGSHDDEPLRLTSCSARITLRLIRSAIDTGPLVALLNSRDAHHRWATQTLDKISPPLHTCEAVVSEACFLVRNLKGGPDAVLALLARGLVVPDFHLDSELDAIRKLVSKYSTVPMSLADACLVRMAELDHDLGIITLDEDFRIYRRHGRQQLPVVMPESRS